MMNQLEKIQRALHEYHEEVNKSGISDATYARFVYKVETILGISRPRKEEKILGKDVEDILG